MVQLPSEPEKHLFSSTLTFPQVESLQHRTHMTKVPNHAQTHLSSQHFGFKPMKLFTTSYSCYSNILLSININCCSKLPSIGRSCAAGVRDIFAWMTFHFPLLPTAVDPGSELTMSCLPSVLLVVALSCGGQKAKETPLPKAQLVQSCLFTAKFPEVNKRCLNLNAGNEYFW